MCLIEKTCIEINHLKKKKEIELNWRKFGNIHMLIFQIELHPIKIKLIATRMIKNLNI